MAQAMQFQDGKSYESMMGIWSALVGTDFLHWLQIPVGAKWADIGCGNGASTELIVHAAKPSRVEALDPSEAQLEFARKRHHAGIANFTLGSALDLPYPDDAFDAAIMALVIFFVPDPARGVAEMKRVVRAGGIAAAYAWDMEGGGFPYEQIHVAMRTVGAEPLRPPHFEAANLSELRRLWTDGGLIDVQTRAITVTRVFGSAEEFWSIATSSPGIAPILATLDDRLLQQVHAAVLANHGPGEIAVNGRAHAVQGRVSA